jgi:hypothetical protein
VLPRVSAQLTPPLSTSASMATTIVLPVAMGALGGTETVALHVVDVACP